MMTRLGPLASDMDATRHEALRRRRGELYRIRRANETPEEGGKENMQGEDAFRSQNAEGKKWPNLLTMSMLSS